MRRRESIVLVLAMLQSCLLFSQASQAKIEEHQRGQEVAPSTPGAQTPAAQAPQPPTLQVWTPPGSAAQTQPPARAAQPPSYSNYSIMLVNPAGGAVVLMHNPNNQLEFVDVKSIQHALSAGYVPVRAVELGEFISALQGENARLTEENARLQSEQAKSAVDASNAARAAASERLSQQAAQFEAEKAARRQQMIQSWLMLQNMNRPQTYQIQPYRPLPTVAPNTNRLQTNCMTQYVGGTAYTNCN